MMELLLDRKTRSIKSTIGHLNIDGEFECFILEDVDRGLKSDMPLTEITERKLKGETCIPEGRYQIVRTMSLRFGKVMPVLLGVPGYDGIRIHPGNTDINTEGCLLPGEGKGVDKVMNSTKAFDKLDKKFIAALARNEKIFITVKS